MREFIYVSDNKLRQFAAPPRRLRRTAALRLSTPLGGIELDAPVADAEQARQRHLNQVSEHLEESSRWFAEPDLRPGHWVWFEAPLRQICLTGRFRQLVLFADPAPGEDRAYDEEAGCRLLMHGSARHLLGQPPEQIEGLPLEGIAGGDSIGTTFLTQAGQVVQTLALQQEPAADGDAPRPGLPEGGVRDLVHALDSTSGRAHTAAWTRGFARVTALLPSTPGNTPCLVASPLTVEYAPDLP
ncbi:MULTISPECIES: SAVMC3_10250 family protein [unclassified Streptomyces]|uniref:SAVMC3_10250 family protein n=1 Tax=unclassified Streptomyces TaxID=2593676 RepID=UPI003827F87E